MTCIRVLVAPLFILLVGVASHSLAQSVSCACDPAPGRTCHGTITCPNGCTSLCGSGDSCYLSCRSDTFKSRVTAKYVQKTGQEIAALLSTETHKRIEFVPFPRNEGQKYDLQLKDDDLFNVLNYLYKRGKVRFDNVDFSRIRKLRLELHGGKKISINFVGVSAQDAVSRLSFASGKRLRIKSGDPNKIISVSMSDATLNDIVSQISKTAGVSIRK